MKVFAWNPNGLRSLLRDSKTELETLLRNEQPDVLFFPETKGNQKAETVLNKDLTTIFNSALPDREWSFHHSYCQTAIGRHGNSVAVANNRVLINDIRFGFDEQRNDDEEGRVIILDCSSKSDLSLRYHLIGLYVPNASTNLKRLQYKLDWMKSLTQFVVLSKLPVIVIGDINVAPDERDICNPESNLKTPGYTIQERECFKEFVTKCDLVDVWREQNQCNLKSKSGVYTFWNTRSRARERNAGWRIDLVLMSKTINAICRSKICTNIKGSDHCPIGIEL